MNSSIHILFFYIYETDSILELVRYSLDSSCHSDLLWQLEFGDFGSDFEIRNKYINERLLVYMNLGWPNEYKIHHIVPINAAPASIRPNFLYFSIFSQTLLNLLIFLILWIFSHHSKLLWQLIGNPEDFQLSHELHVTTKYPKPVIQRLSCQGVYIKKRVLGPYNWKITNRSPENSLRFVIFGQYFCEYARYRPKWLKSTT